MDEDAKFKMMMAGTAGIFLVMLLYVGATGTGLFTINDTNTTDPLADCNASLIACTAETSTLVNANTRQSNTIANVNDQLNTTKNERDRLQTDLNLCNADKFFHEARTADLNQKAYDANVARTICQNNLNLAINLRSICLGSLADLNTQIEDINAIIDGLHIDLNNCSDAANTQANTIDTLNTSISALNTTIFDLNTETTTLKTTIQDLNLNLNTTENYLCNFDSNWCCDFNTSWGWCNG